MFEKFATYFILVAALLFHACSDPLGSPLTGDSKGNPPTSAPSIPTDEVIKEIASNDKWTPQEKKLIDDLQAIYTKDGAAGALEFLNTAYKPEVPEHFEALSIAEDGSQNAVEIPSSISLIEKIAPELRKIIRFEGQATYYKAKVNPYGNPGNSASNTVKAYGTDYYLMDTKGNPFDLNTVGDDVFLYGHQLPATDPQSTIKVYTQESFNGNGTAAYYSGILPNEHVSGTWEVESAYQKQGIYLSQITWTEPGQTSTEISYNCLNGSFSPRAPLFAILTKSLYYSGIKYVEKTLPVFVVHSKTKDISTLEGVKTTYKENGTKRIFVTVHGTKMFQNSTDLLDYLPVALAEEIRNLVFLDIKPFNIMKETKRKNELMLVEGTKNFRKVITDLNSGPGKKIDQLVSFSWNGGNDDKYRQKAAIELKKLIYGLAAENMYNLQPVEIVLVGHSHGNSVIGIMINHLNLKDFDTMGGGIDRHISLNGIARDEAGKDYVQRKIRQVNFFMKDKMHGDGVAPRAWNDWIMMDNPAATTPFTPEFNINIFQLFNKLYAELAAFEHLYEFKPINAALAHDLDILSVCGNVRGWVNQDDNPVAAFQRIDQWRYNHEVSFMNAENLKNILTRGLSPEYPSSLDLSILK